MGRSPVGVGRRVVITPTRRLALLVILAGPVWLVAWVPGVPRVVGVWAGFVAVGLLVLAAAVDAAALPPRGRVTVERSVPPAVGVGDRVEGSYRVGVRWPAVRHGWVYDALPPGVRRETPMPQWFALGGASGAGVAAGGRADGGVARAVGRLREAVLPVAIVGRGRGEWPLGEIAVRVHGPFELVVRTYRFRPDDRITVAPSTAGVRRYRLLAMQHRLRDAGVRLLRRRGEGTSFAGLREYAIGDDPRFIDWKASARREALVTREFSIEQGQTVMIVIDCGRLMTQVAGDLPRFEYALSSALVLADVASGSGDHVGVLAFDDRIRAWVSPARGGEALRAIRSALIPLAPTMTEPDYGTAFRTLAARQRKRALIVFYTDVIDPRASQSLIAHTTRGARQHLPVVVALRNEALVAAAVRPAPTTTAVYERAAAEELLSAREEALGRMRQAGVSVIDVRPQAMTAAVVNRYLELKGRGAV